VEFIIYFCFLIDFATERLSYWNREIKNQLKSI
jgi:hypothetical protein